MTPTGHLISVEHPLLWRRSWRWLPSCGDTKQHNKPKSLMVGQSCLAKLRQSTSTPDGDQKKQKQHAHLKKFCKSWAPPMKTNRDQNKASHQCKDHVVTYMNCKYAQTISTSKVHLFLSTSFYINLHLTYQYIQSTYSISESHCMVFLQGTT